MSRIQIRQRSEENERFATDAFVDQIGRTVPLRIGVRSVVRATVVAAEVIRDGAEVLLTIDAPGVSLDELGSGEVYLDQRGRL